MHAKSEAFSLDQDNGSMSSLSSNEWNLRPSKEKAKITGVCSFEEGAGLECIVINEGNQLESSVDNHRSHTDDELLQSYDLPKNYLQSNISADSGSKSCKPPLVNNWCSTGRSGNLDLVLLGSKPLYPSAVMSVNQPSRGVKIKCDQFHPSRLGKNATYSIAIVDSKKKMHKKSKKISEIKFATLCETERSHPSSSYGDEADTEAINNCSSKAKPSEVHQCLKVHARKSQCCCRLSSCSEHQSWKKSQRRKFHHDDDPERDYLKKLNFDDSMDEPLDTGKQLSMACQLKDDDLLISAIIQKNFRSSST